IAEWQKSADTAEQNWKTLFAEYKAEYPEEAKTLEKWLSGDIPTEQLDDDAFWNYTGDIATRVSSEQVLNRLCKFLPNLFGGAADLAPSTKTLMKGRGDYSKETPTGANLHFGIREHAMTAIANGMAVHGGVIPYAAGFFVFSDYMKPAMRLSAMMSLRVIFIMTHDSIGVGEDGPTHQPIEQLSALRAIPNFTVIRPCDTHETAAAWYLAVTRKKSPTAIVLSRQNLPLLQETGKGALKGAYVLRRSDKEIPDVILMASGSEVELIYKAKDVLAERGIDASVVSFPSWEVFEEQTPEYKESVLPAACTKRLAVEAASELGWHKYIGMDGAILSIDHFGMSAPAPQVFDEMGFTVENVVQKAMNLFKD
ncbi:MAG: transketolase, partial [Clostridiales bacterium]|nr:transketolase [Clostridiales bacterium]